MNNIIRVKDLSKSIYSKQNPPVKIIDDISFEVHQGELLAICGVSGSGKTTLLKMISGMVKPDSGSIIIGDEDILKLDDSKLSKLRNEKIGFVFQSFALIPDRTVYGNVVIPLKISGTYTRKQEKEMVDRALKEVNFIEPDKLTENLSGGEKQRVAIARAIVNNPDIIFADEPTGSLDRANKEMVFSLLMKMKEMNKTVIMVTHDIELAGRCDRIINLTDGKIV